ncbi:MAG: Mur ligase family protein [Actinomycetota bacterium]|nr:Mur ligase family protein [Actinomycetota bacterium]
MQPLAGRKLYFVGIGGAGLSGYALLAHAWGAEVSGWDRYETPYLEYLPHDITVTVSDSPDPPGDAETIVSSAFVSHLPGRSRADFLAELVSLQDSIVVAGAHGKTTTAAMIAFVLDRLGRDPGFLIGAEIPQLGGNGRAGSGWLVVEGDESDRTIEHLRPKIAVVTNVDLDHHTEFASRTEVEELFARWLDDAPEQVRGETLEPYDGELGLTGDHNRRNAATALAALDLAGVDGREAWPVLREFRGAGRRLQEVGVAGDVRVVDDYAHHPAEIHATLAAIREQGDGRILALFQPHLYSRTRHLARETAAALAGADAVAVTEIYAAREDPVEGVSGKLVVDALAELRPGMPIAWTPRVEDGVKFLTRRARPGDVVLTVGAGDVDRAAPLVLEELE